MYNANGYLQKIVKAGDNSLIWQCNNMNAYGQVTAASAGNSTTTTNQYSALGLLQSTKLAPNATPAQYLLDYGYSFDITTGNLTSRSNVIRGLTETFTYDGDNLKLDRLTGAALNGGNTLNLTFADNGNITTKSDAGTFSYDPGAHAIINISNCTPNIPGTLQDITYTPFKKVLSIDEGILHADFIYGPDFERKKMVTKQSGTTIETKYYQANYEKIITPGKTRELHYISSNNGLCAIYTKNNGADSMYYVNTDHLGSITAISTHAGTITEERSYDAWGRLRNPANWTYTGIPAMGITARGYTTHEHLTAFRLINMNGRCYDPVLGRMLSPDNFVSSPFNTQDYNRFSYARNNPLKYTDPDGNSIILASIIVGATVFAYLGGTAANQGKFNPLKWNWKSGKTYVGIGIGATAGALGGWGFAVAAPILAGTGFFASFGASGVAAAYGITGTVAGGAAGYATGFGAGYASTGSMTYAKQAGSFYGGLGAAIGGGIGAVYGLASGYKPEGPIPEIDKSYLASTEGGAEMGRPDADGYLTLEEANNWYRTGGGRPLQADLGKVNLSRISASDFPDGPGSSKMFNMLNPSYMSSMNDGLVYGSIDLTLNRGNIITATRGYDNYNFNMQPGWSFRNFDTWLGHRLAGSGTGYRINFYGSYPIR